jgi:hypothetical protein
MTRIRTRLAVAAAVAAVVLGACGGGGDATQSDVQDTVEDILLEDGFDGRTFDEEDAQAGAECVATTMFESDDFTKDERNEVARATNGDPPSDELVAKTEDLIGGCLADLGIADEPA